MDLSGKNVGDVFTGPDGKHYAVVDPGKGTYKPYNDSTWGSSWTGNDSTISGAIGGSSGGGGNTDWASMMQQAIDIQTKANQPAISTLQSSIDPLKAQYDKLLADINGQQKVATDAATVTTNNELGKRGILPSSTLASQEVQKTTAPISTQYGALANQATMGETKDIGNINNAIAQLQAGGTGGAMSSAMNFVTSQQSLAAQQQQNAAQNAIAQAQLKNQTAETNYAINKPYYDPNTGGGGTGGITIGGDTGGQTTNYLRNSAGQIWTNTTKYPTEQFTGKDGKTYQRYSDGSSGPTLWS